LRCRALRFNVLDPTSHDDRVGARVEGRAVASQPSVTVSDSTAARLRLRLSGGIGVARCLHSCTGCVEVLGIEDGGEPRVNGAYDAIFAEVHRAGVFEPFDPRVLPWKRAAVVG